MRNKFNGLAASLALVGLSACVNNNIVEMEAQVAQQQDLKDYDSDGVIKARERCGGTILGARIDNYGCGTQIELVEPIQIDIKFAHDSSAIPSASYPKIEKIADFLILNPELAVTIEGHTSMVGTQAYNQKLSQRRAQAVAQILVDDYGVQKERVTTVGFAFDRLIAYGDSEQAHAVNRRIIADISDSSHIDEMKWHIYTVEQQNLFEEQSLFTEQNQGQAKRRW